MFMSRKANTDMLELFEDGNTLLHKAVLDDDFELIKSLHNDRTLFNKTNQLGYTALELAQLLGKKKCTHILVPSQPLFIQYAENDRSTKLLTEDRFSEVFGVQYLPFLQFESYSDLKKIIQQCPWYLKKTFLGKENRWLGFYYEQELKTGFVADVYIKQVNEQVGYGLFANNDLQPLEFIGEYTGVVKERKQLNPYCFRYPTGFWRWHSYMIDSSKKGNYTRFINHSDNPNLIPFCVLNRGILHIIFRAKNFIFKDTQLTFNYGSSYWRKALNLKQNLTQTIN